MCRRWLQNDPEAEESSAPPVRPYPSPLIFQPGFENILSPSLDQRYSQYLYVCVGLHGSICTLTYIYVRLFSLSLSPSLPPSVGLQVLVLQPTDKPPVCGCGVIFCPISLSHGHPHMQTTGGCMVCWHVGWGWGQVSVARYMDNQQ